MILGGADKFFAAAYKIVTGDRAEDYGDPEENMARIAAYWSVLFGVTVEPWQVPLAMDLLKTSRLQHSPSHEDGWVDKAGYSALGWWLACRT